MNISDEAVEAAAKVMYAQDSQREDVGEFSLEVYEHDAREILEAAHTCQQGHHTVCQNRISENPTADELDAILQLQNGDYGVEAPEWWPVLPEAKEALDHALYEHYKRTNSCAEDGFCCTPDSGDCCGPGSWCCERAGRHDHENDPQD